jgi:hypothetical protein
MVNLASRPHAGGRNFPPVFEVLRTRTHRGEGEDLGCRACGKGRRHTGIQYHTRNKTTRAAGRQGRDYNLKLTRGKIAKSCPSPDWNKRSMGGKDPKSGQVAPAGCLHSPRLAGRAGGRRARRGGGRSSGRAGWRQARTLNRGVRAGGAASHSNAETLGSVLLTDECMPRQHHMRVQPHPLT